MIVTLLPMFGRSQNICEVVELWKKYLFYKKVAFPIAFSQK